MKTEAGACLRLAIAASEDRVTSKEQVANQVFLFSKARIYKISHGLQDAKEGNLAPVISNAPC